MLSPSDYNSAVPQFTNGNYASNPINPLYIEEPASTDYNRGVEPLQTLPAQWWNWFANQFTVRFNKLNIYVKNIFNELAQLLSLVSITPDGTEESPTVGQLKTMFQTNYPQYIALLMYPVGSIYWTSKAPNNGGDPNVLFGGTWVRIKDRFVIAAGDTYTNGNTGGSATKTLTTNNMPSHSHTFTGTAVTSGAGTSHSHGLNSHVHSVGAHSHGLNSHVHSVGAHSHGLNSHTHNMTHFHTRGNMEITGQISNSGGTFGVLGFDAGSGAFSDAFSGATFSGKTRTGEGGGSAAKVVKFKASSGWSGYTSDALEASMAPKPNTGAATGNTANSTAFNTGAATGSTAFSTAFNTGAATGNTATESAHTHSVTASGTIGSNGSGTAFDIMPPYVVKYCWERTA